MKFLNHGLVVLNNKHSLKQNGRIVNYILSLGFEDFNSYKLKLDGSLISFLFLFKAFFFFLIFEKKFIASSHDSWQLLFDQHNCII